MSTGDDVADRSNRRRRAWRAYRWGARANWLAWLFSSKAEMAVVAAAVGVIGTGAVLTTRDALESRRIAKTPAIAERIGPDAQAFQISGVDEAGRRGRFLVVVMQKDIGWVRKSTTELVRNNETIAPAEVSRVILGGDVRRRLAAADQVIAVGTASQEGDVIEETHRAGKRAEQAAKWVEPILPKGTGIWTLNLGQYRDPCVECETGDTSWQRPFILIAVDNLEPGTDMGQALSAAMTLRSNLPPPAAYSTFGLTRFR